MRAVYGRFVMIVVLAERGLCVLADCGLVLIFKASDFGTAD